MKGLTYNSPLFRLGDFLIGCILGQMHLVTKQEKGERVFISEALCLLLFLGCCLYREAFSAEDNDWWTTTTLPLLGSVAIVWEFSRNSNKISNALSSIPLLVYIGDISPEAFLIHQPVIRVIRWASLKSNFIPNADLFIGLSAFFLTVLFSHFWMTNQRIKTKD